MKTSHPLSQHRGNKMCFNKFWTQMSSKLPFPERPAISLDGLLLSLINLCGGGGYTLWIPPQKHLLVMRGMFDSGPFSTIRRLFCVGCLALDRSPPSACFFLFLFLVFDFLVFWFCFVLRGMLSSGPCAFLRSASVFLSPDLLFSLYFPSAQQRNWKMRISLTLLHCQLSGCCTCSELEESMLLSNPFAPHVKDKKQDAWF